MLQRGSRGAWGALRGFRGGWGVPSGSRGTALAEGAKNGTRKKTRAGLEKTLQRVFRDKFIVKAGQGLGDLDIIDLFCCFHHFCWSFQQNSFSVPTHMT